MLDPSARSGTLSLCIIWLASFAIPVSLMPHCHNTALIKLLVFTVASGLLLGLNLMKSKGEIGLISLISVAAISLITAIGYISPSNSATSRILLIYSAAAMFLALKTCGKQSETILLPVLTGGCTAIAISLINGSSSARLAGTFGNANLMGSYAAALIPAGSMFLLKLKGRRKLLLLPFLALTLTALLRSGTRSSMIALPAGILLVALIRFKPGAVLPASLLGFVILVSVTGRNPVFPAMGRIETLEARRIIWSGAWEMFQAKPLFGWGTGSFQREFPRFRHPAYSLAGVTSNTVHAHSEPLEILAENGLAGFILVAGAVFLLFWKASERKLLTSIQAGAAASAAVLVIESLGSVALRWTPSVFLFAVMLAVLASFERKIALPRLMMVSSGVAGFALCVVGGAQAYLNLRSSCALGRALTALETGAAPSEVRGLCQNAIDFNGNEWGAWYTLGNSWGLEKIQLQSGSDPTQYSRHQLAAYDSLAARAPDFSWMRLNRIDPLIELGEFDRAMDDILHIYRTRLTQRSEVLLTGYTVAPVASPEKTLLMMNLELCGVLKQEAVPQDHMQLRHERVLNSICSVYAVAGVLCPELVAELSNDRDSILAGLDGEVLSGVVNTLDAELAVCFEGEQLLQRAYTAPAESVYHAASVVIESGLFAPWHRASLIIASSRLSDGSMASVAHDYVETMMQPCRGMLHLMPGKAEIIVPAAMVSALSGDSQHPRNLSDYLLYLCETDEALFETEMRTGFSADLSGKTGLPFTGSWAVSNGESILEQLEGVPGTDSPQFRITRAIALNGLSITVAGAAQDSFLNSAAESLSLVMEELIMVHGEGQGRLLFTEYAGNALQRFQQGPLSRRAYEAARLIVEYSSSDF